MQILIVEDDAELADLLGRILKEEGHSLDFKSSLREAAQAIADARFDVVVLDRMLPDGDALELCAQLRRRGEDVPILMLTARSDVSERVSGLRTGADDYLGKPFEIEELLARLAALQRRGRGSWLVEQGPLQLDRRARTVRVDGQRIDLTVRELALLERLAVARGEVVARQTLLEDVWNMRFDPGTSLLNVHISRLRDKLGRFAWLVETVPNRGYRLRAAR